MKKPTTKAVLRLNKAKDKGFINVRYTYDREYYPFPTGYSVNVCDFDAKRERVNFNVSGSSEINAKIKELKITLEHLANQYIEQGKAPTIGLMKEAYQETKDFEIQYREEKEKQEGGASIFLGGIEKNEQKILDLLAEIETVKQENEFLKLRTVETLPLVDLNYLLEKAPEATTETAAKKLFLDTLNAYVLEKTGVGIKATKEELAEHPRAKKGTNKVLRSWGKTLVEFIDSKFVKKAGLEISFQNLSSQFYDTYAKFCQSPIEDGGKDFYNNTFGTHVKRLKSWLNWVTDSELGIPVDTRYKKKFIILEEDIEVISMPLEEIELFYNWEAPARTEWDSIRYRQFQDFTLFSVLTSLRISDVKASKGLRIVDGYLNGKAQKTGNAFRIPLNLDSRIEELLEKYDYRIGELFCEVTYNREIKKLLQRFFDEHQMYQRPIIQTRHKYINQKPITSEHKMADLWASHSNRRSHVSHFSQFYDDGLVMKWMGTKSLKEYLKYKKETTEEVRNKVEQGKKSN
ncbi:hypothetical protein [Rufibacter sp. LB8]|uniref:hypothetical protein n=1 Tax=Rufibacter sp. LB8 TaxID=2777781 RepID=UPI00178C5524|nr:hypothetical protein [Rufibacter sp. LB8]